MQAAKALAADTFERSGGASSRVFPVPTIAASTSQMMHGWISLYIRSKVLDRRVSRRVCPLFEEIQEKFT